MNQAAARAASNPRSRRADRQTPRKLDNNDLKSLWRLLNYTKPYKVWLFGASITGLIRMILPLYIPIFIKHVTDDVLLAEGLTTPQRLQVLWSMMPVLVCILIVHALATLARQYWAKTAEANAVRDIRQQLFDHIQRLSLEFHNTRPTGSIVTRVMSDVSTAQTAFDLLFVQAMQQLLIASWTAGLMLYNDWQWGLVALSTLPIFGITTRLLRTRVRQASRQVMETNSRISGHLQERISMVREVQSFTAENYERRRVQGQTHVLRGYTMRQVFLQAVLMTASEITQTLGLIVVVVFGAYRVVNGTATVGDLTLFVQYTQQLLNPVNFISNLYTNLQNTSVAAERVNEFLDTVSLVRDKPESRELNIKRPPEVRFENITFHYPAEDDNLVLEEVGFTAEAGMRVVLVGGSGSGKSTLMNLLARFYEIKDGAIIIGEQDIRDVTTHSLRQNIGIVPQQPVLFRGTVRDNILYGRRGASDEEIQNATRLANAEDFILELPDGYDTEVGERGVGLSGGQIQRIAIARAFLKDPAILILDEATSALDATSEALVLEALNRLAVGRTTFIIAHRLSVARTADLIVVMHNGRIVEQGVHEDLLKTGSVYNHLWDQQMVGTPASR